MRIVSKHRDYWDYIPKIYDPSQQSPLVYHRKEKDLRSFDDNEFIQEKSLIRKLKNEIPLFFNKEKNTSFRYENGWEFGKKVFFFAGKIYKKVNVYKNLSFVKSFWTSEELNSFIEENKIVSAFNYSKKHPKYFFEQGVLIPEKYRWERDLISSSVHVLDTVSIEFGLSNILTPDQAYQEFSMHYANIINISETENHDILTDKEKIESKGMDVKKSFRHRQ